MKVYPVLLATIAAGLVLSGCSSASEPQAAGSAAGSGGAVSAADCNRDALKTLSPGTLVVATGQPAFEPWVTNDAPETGEGFEAAVAYAAAAKLGYSQKDVKWIRTTFDSAVAPGVKDFDWNLQQYSITPARAKAVDFSSPYYDVSQAVITYEGSPIAGATTLAALKDAKLGAAVGSTSLDDAEKVIDPSKQVHVFNDNAAAVTALKNKQIDGIVVDLPTAFYLTSAELDNGKIVGALPQAASGAADEFGILLAKNSPITACTSWALDELRADGTLASLQEKWLGAQAGVPTLK
jgi:polar amino acid transport system substrate-binding protein